MVFFFAGQYAIVFFISLISSFRRRVLPFVYPVAFLVLFLFTASRSLRVTRDDAVYVKYFEMLTVRDDYWREVNHLAYFEPAFYLVPWTAKALGGRRYYVPISFAIFAFLGVYFKFRSFKYSNSFFLSTILYASSFYLLHEMTQIRIGVSTGLLMCSLKYVYHRQFSGFLRLVMAACFFHYASLLFLPVYLLSPQRMRWRLYLIILIAAMGLALSGNDLLHMVDISGVSEKVKSYNALKNEAGYNKLNVFSYNFLINYGLCLFLLFRAKALMQHNPYTILLVKVNILSVCSLVAFSSIPVFAARINELFGVANILLFPVLIYCFRQKSVAYAFIFGYSLLNFYNFVVRNNIFYEYSVWWI